MNAIQAASFLIQTYRNKNNGAVIDEMKLHKLLYFAQRESLIIKKEPLFSDEFYGWMYGPVCKTIRRLYQENKIEAVGCLFTPDDYSEEDKKILSKVFENYGSRDSWSLSRLTQGELSWKKSRSGLKSNDRGDKVIPISDIRYDAERIRKRREFLTECNGKN